MKRETARREIDHLDFYLQNHTDDYSEKSHMAMMMAIKALEQEPCEDCISRTQAQTELEMKACRYTLAKERGGTGKVEWGSRLIDIADAVNIIRNLPSTKPQEPCGKDINVPAEDGKKNVFDKIRDEIDTQDKWLAQAGYNAYNVDIAFNSIKRVIAESEEKI